MARFPLEKWLSVSNLFKKDLFFLVLSLALLVLFSFKPAFAESKVNYESDVVSTFFSPYKVSKKNMEKYTEIMRVINVRNATVEDSQEWIEEAYKMLKIRSLNEIPQEEYAKYKKYSGSKGRLYIIVHPSYYTFFGTGDMSNHPLSAELEKLNKVISKDGPYPDKNLVERLYDKLMFDEPLYIMQQQERLLRDFVEGYSTKGDLMLLILPRNYRKRLYAYQEGYDEYARYINEITNESDSVIYMYSEAWNSGGITRKDSDMLNEFLDETQIKTIVLGGGYVGRCLQTFYNQMITDFGYDHIYMVPEITAVSPNDIKGKWADNLITKSGRLNLPQLYRNLKIARAYGTYRTIPKLKRFYMYRFLKAELTRQDGERLNNDDE